VKCSIGMSLVVISSLCCIVGVIFFWFLGFV